MLPRISNPTPDISARHCRVPVERNVCRAPNFNGTPTTFKYKFRGTPPSGNAEGAPTWLEYWRCRNIAVERNVVELAKTLESSGPAVGVVMSGNNSNNPSLYPLTFRRYLARENTVRHFEGTSDPNRVDGVTTNNCEKGIVQHNLIGLKSPYPTWRLIQNYGQVAFFDNHGSSGEFLKPYDNSTTRFLDDANCSPIEDATIMGLL